MSLIGKSIGGCGCTFFMVIAVSVSFWAGAKYGGKIKKELETRFSAIVSNTKAGIAKVDHGIKKAQEAADALSDDDRRDKRNDSQK